MRHAGRVADWNKGIIEEFRANGGKVGGYFDGATVLLLTIGRRSGKDHVTPLVYLPDGERWAVVGSKGGAPADPDWVRNLEANGEATIEWVPRRSRCMPRRSSAMAQVGRPLRAAGRTPRRLRGLPREDRRHPDDPVIVLERRAP